MRASRDVVRPLLALAVVVGAVLLASNVAAYRTATTPSEVTKSPQTPAAVHADDDRAPARRSDDDGDSDESRRGDDDGGGRGDDGVVVVTETGAS